MTKGSQVKKGDVVCIIEAMKLMNEIAAEEEGQIVEVCVQNGQIVEYGQTLLNFPERRWKMNREEIMRIIPHRRLCCWWTRRKKRMKTAAAAPTP